jgi:DNA (cytosine-5)-methyltransferase 1
VLDLFAGAGGMSAGFHKGSSRYRTVKAVEMDPAAAASYAANHGDVVYAGSIQDWLQTEAVPKVDVVIGGPPCQGFSTLGKQDAEDLRNFLWKHYAETVRRAQPKFFVVENVAAFAKSPQFEDFQRETSENGKLSNYTFKHWILNAADYGAPQARKRAVIIGWRDDQEFSAEEPAATHGSGRAKPHVTVSQAFDERRIAARVVTKDLPSKSATIIAGRAVLGPYTPRELHVTRHYTDMSLERFADIPRGGNRFDIDESRLPECWKKHKTGSGDVMGRLHEDRPSVTIRTEFFKPEKGRYLHPTEDRAITHYEAATLQGFPEDYKFMGTKTEIARQIGNAVPIELGAAIGRHIASFLRS